MPLDILCLMSHLHLLLCHSPTLSKVRIYAEMPQYLKLILSIIMSIVIINALASIQLTSLLWLVLLKYFIKLKTMEPNFCADYLLCVCNLKIFLSGSEHLVSSILGCATELGPHINREPLALFAGSHSHIYHIEMGMIHSAVMQEYDYHYFWNFDLG